MDNKKRLEEIKMRMRHMEEDLKEFHKLQLKWFEEIMNLSDLDEVDMVIEDFNEGFVETVKVINSIKIDALFVELLLHLRELVATQSKSQVKSI